MNALRLFVWALGALLVIGALVALYFATGLSAWVPFGIAVIALVMVAGMFLMALANRAGNRKVVHVHRQTPGKTDPGRPPSRVPAKAVIIDAKVEKESHVVRAPDGTPQRITTVRQSQRSVQRAARRQARPGPRRP
ncbi:MAG TPA: hypothetical protein VI796_07475 [Candidatus Thermoplasmatota archaeon]|nr:hypothetical protein [Candidatus Thermoplasmatota archaeon]